MAGPIVVIADDAEDDLVARSVVDQLASSGAGPPLVTATVESGEIDGVEGAFVAVAPPEVPGVMSALVAAGVARAVLLSSAAAPFERGAPGDQQWFLPAERAVESSGVAWTIVRPVGLMTAALAWADDVRTANVVRHPYAAAAYPHVHEADVAAVVAEALVGPGHDGARYAVSGPASITPVEQTEALAEAVGRPLRFEELGPEEAAARWRAAGWTDDSVELELMLLADFVLRAPRPRDTVRRVTGRPARTFARWAADHRDAFC